MIPTDIIITLAKNKAIKKLHRLGFYKISYYPEWSHHQIIVQGSLENVDIDTTDFKVSKHTGFLDYYEGNINICLT